MPALSRFVALVFSLTVTAQLFGQVRHAPIEAGRPPTQIAPQPHETDVDLIVEFRQPSVPSGLTAMASRTRSVQTHVDALRGDLERLHGQLRTRGIAVDAATPAYRIDHVYSRVLYGAGIRVRRELRKEIAALPYVASVEVARTFRTTLTDSVPRIAAPTVWSELGTRGKGVVVAVIDTGVDYTHDAFGGGIGPGFKVIGGWDFANDDADPKDDNGHGSHVAGIVAGNGGGVLGVAPEASLLAYKALNASGAGFESNVIAAIERTVDPDQNGDPSDRAHIVNLSLGGKPSENDPLTRAVENAVAAGIVFCLSAGNTGDYGAVPSPAVAPSAITIGASDRTEAIADFSSRGPTYEYGIKPEVVAPGVGILSVAPGGGTRAISGTSMAAPHVSGVAALLKSLHPTWTPADIKAAIVSSSIPVADEPMAAGAGRVNAWNAATTTILPSITTIDFGRIDTKQEVWRTSRTITLRNLSSQSQTLTSSVTGERAGVIVTVTPASITLAGNESKSVTIDIAATNALVPQPDGGSYSYGGHVQWSGSAVPVRLPWAFVKASYITIEMLNHRGLSQHINILGNARKWGLFGDRQRMLWRHEKVDIVATDNDLPYHIAAVIAEEVDVETEPFVSIDMTDARYLIDTETTDAKGEMLIRPDRACIEQILMRFPGGRLVSYEDPIDDPDLAGTLFSAMSPRVKIYTAIGCSDPATNELHYAAHPPHLGLEGDLTSTLRPSWLRQEIRHRQRSDETGTTFALATLRFPGPEFTYFINGATAHPFFESGPGLTLLYTKAPSAETDIVFIHDRSTTTGCGERPECGFVDQGYVYLGEETHAIDSDIFLSISPFAYRVPAGTPITYGETPPTAHGSLIAAASDLWTCGVVWRGPVGERLMRDTANAMARVYDANGTLVAEGKAGFGRVGTLPPGSYRLSSQTEYTIAGRPGRASYSGRVDRRGSDVWIPKIMGLRIVDSQEKVISAVRKGAAASLLFAIADQSGSSGNSPKEEATRVEYRVHGTNDWHPLPALVVARHFEPNSFLLPGVGSVFRVDLSAALGLPAAAIDLRIHAEDAAGNTTEMLLEPALIIEGGPRRRAVGH